MHHYEITVSEENFVEKGRWLKTTELEYQLKIKIKLAHQDRKDPPKIITRFIKFLKIQNEYVFC
jgi:hypothetical protein